ncbi:hypothetical protein ACEWBX_22160 [Vibrio parahaemolyticus]
MWQRASHLNWALYFIKRSDILDVFLNGITSLDLSKDNIISLLAMIVSLIAILATFKILKLTIEANERRSKADLYLGKIEHGYRQVSQLSTLMSDIVMYRKYLDSIKSEGEDEFEKNKDILLSKVSEMNEFIHEFQCLNHLYFSNIIFYNEPYEKVLENVDREKDGEYLKAVERDCMRLQDAFVKERELYAHKI